MRILKGLYINNLFYLLMMGVIAVFVIGFFLPEMQFLGKPLLLGVLLLLLIDIVILFANSEGIHATRDLVEKMSNGDDNEVKLLVQSFYQFPVSLEVIDELPKQFQARDQSFQLHLSPAEEQPLQYIVRPLKRGQYHWGAINVFVKSPFRIASRRYRFAAGTMVPVYPSFIQMKKYEFLAISNRLVEAGIKRLRKIGQNSEFEQIKDYIPGDDIRTVNWKATARRGQMMVNQYQEERSQPVYCVIDMGRLMQMPFNGLSLLDYAINSSLVMSNIALYKQDKAGIVTFSHEVHSVLKASNRNTQLRRIMEQLYHQKTGYLETDYQRLYTSVKRKITTRSLFILYTNFESVASLNRQMPYFRRLAKDHLLVVIFFENTELHDILDQPAANTEGVYNKVIAEKFEYEKKQIMRAFKKYGIHVVMSRPEDLSVNSINKYLELKSRGYI